MTQVFRKGNHGWCYGDNQRTGKSGLFPAIVAVLLKPTEEIIQSIYADIETTDDAATAVEKPGSICGDPVYEELPREANLKQQSVHINSSTGDLTPYQIVDTVGSPELVHEIAGRPVAGEEQPVSATAIYAVPNKSRKKSLPPRQGSDGVIASSVVPSAVTCSNIVAGGGDNVYTAVLPRRTSMFRAISPLPSRQHQAKEMHSPSVLVGLDLAQRAEGSPGAGIRPTSTSDLVRKCSIALMHSTAQRNPAATCEDFYLFCFQLLQLRWIVLWQGGHSWARQQPCIGI